MPVMRCLAGLIIARPPPPDLTLSHLSKGRLAMRLKTSDDTAGVIPLKFKMLLSDLVFAFDYEVGSGRTT